MSLLVVEGYKTAGRPLEKRWKLLAKVLNFLNNFEKEKEIVEVESKPLLTSFPSSRRPAPSARAGRRVPMEAIELG